MYLHWLQRRRQLRGIGEALYTEDDDNTWMVFVSQGPGVFVPREDGVLRGFLQGLVSTPRLYL